MLTITNKDGNVHIFYDKELEIKSAEALSFSFLLILILAYLLFKDINYYKYIVFIFFYPAVSYIRLSFFSKILIIFYDNEIEIQRIRKNKILKKISYPREKILKIMLFERKIKGSQRYYILKFFLQEKTDIILESVCKNDMNKVLKICNKYLSDSFYEKCGDKFEV